MKRILITGKNGYVGTSFEKWLGQFPDKYQVEKISVRDDTWKTYDFSSYDVILHAAGIAHRKETNENRKLYYKINRDLTYKLAVKAKEEGVSHFIFISSMSVFGMETGVITKDTTPMPNNAYGQSKLEAEDLIGQLQGKAFSVTIVRPPMIYGKDCNGNYSKLSKAVLLLPFFPNIKNKRSMIYINNLCEFLRILVNKGKSGIFHPQNKEYVCTSELAKLIAGYHGKRLIITKLFNPLIYIFNNISIIRKVFGNLIYDKNISNNNEIEYEKIEFKETIEATEV